MHNTTLRFQGIQQGLRQMSHHLHQLQKIGYLHIQVIKLVASKDHKLTSINRQYSWTTQRSYNAIAHLPKTNIM